jgi:hypothetical protein
MGGGQSLRVGLNNIDRFAWIGAFSSAPRGMDAGWKNSARIPNKPTLKFDSLDRDWQRRFSIETKPGFYPILAGSQDRARISETEGNISGAYGGGYLAEFLPGYSRK